MDLGTVEQRKERILELLKSDAVSTIVLVGDAGMGKSWMAREISEYAIHEGLSYATLWVSATEKDDMNLLYQAIAHQLSLSFITEEWEDEEENAEQEEWTIESLKQQIRAKLEEKRAALVEGKKYLMLVLDDHEGSKMNEIELRGLRAVLPSSNYSPLKVLITRRKSAVSSITEDTSEVTFGPLSLEGSLTLFCKSVETKVSDIKNFEQFAKDIAKKSMGLPAAISMIAEALNYIAGDGSGAWTLESALEKAAYYEKDNHGGAAKHGEVAKGVNPLLYSAFDMLPSNVIKNCFWYSMQFFHKYVGVHYNQLIAHWIMEGYFDPLHHIEEAYEEGHCVLMELLDRRMLKIQEDNFIVVERAALNMIDCCCQGFGWTDSLGFPSVFENSEWAGLGRITRMNGMIKTSCSPKNWHKVSTLLIDGSRLCREIRESSFFTMYGPQVLAIFNPRFKSLNSTLFKMDKLLVLVLRSSDLLEDITYIKKLKTLTILEISGATPLKSIPYNLFDEMTHLRTLNLSGCQIESLPSLSNLTELRLLILRGCSCLKALPSLKKLINLQILDLSGATSFYKFEDQKTLSSLQKLQIIDLSDTKIGPLPKFQYLKDLKWILLKGCHCLRRLPSLKDLPTLQILDLSGAIKFNEFHDEFIESLGNLKILDLSKTSISQLPSIFCDLSELNLSGCSKLTRLSCTTALKSLKLLNVSDAFELDEIEDESFQHLSQLNYLNLSNTKIKKLPSLFNLSNLHQLLLKNCSLIQYLPEMDGLIRLKVLNLSGCERLVELPNLNVFKEIEVLDLSGCCSLKAKGSETFEHMSCLRKLNLDQCGATVLSEIAAESLEYMTHLQILKLSGITKELPSIPKLTLLTNLYQLSLKDCPGLMTVPSLEALSKLEILDLSGSLVVESLPFLEKLSKLQELLLRGCSNLQALPSLKSLVHLKVLDLSKTGIKEFPYEISELTCLKRLALPDLYFSEVDWGKIKRLPEDVNWDDCGIPKAAEILAIGEKPSILVNGTKIFHLLKENSELQEACFKQIHFSVCPPNEQAKAGEIYCSSDDVILRDIYSRTRYFPSYEKDEQSMQLCGFNSFPTDIENALKHTEYISLTGNKFMEHLSDLDAGNLIKMKGCWLERCPEIKSIFSEKSDVRLIEKQEILWLSNLPKLKSLYGEKVQNVNFKNLRHLHLDSCPKLENVFPSSEFPENLEILQIKFCDSLKTVFEHNESVKGELPKLRKLLLFELPELTSIGVILPPLQKVKIRKCLKLDVTEESLRSKEKIITENVRR